MAGLVADGFLGPFRYSHLTWELLLPGLGQVGARAAEPLRVPRFRDRRTRKDKSQPCELLWQLKRTSPFQAYDHEPLPLSPAVSQRRSTSRSG